MHDDMRMPPAPLPFLISFRFRLAALLSLALVTSTALQAQEEEKLAAFFKAYLDQRFALRPVEATQLGDHRFDSQLEDLNPDARARWLEQTRQAAAELPKRVNYGKLSRAGQIDFEMLQHYLKLDRKSVV